MPTIFFVHGTGVREESYQRTLSQIIEGLGKAGLGSARVQGVSWGRLAGTQFDDEIIRKLIPGTDSRSLDTVDDEEVDALIWEGLLEDPLFELRLMSAQAPVSTDSAFGDQTTPGEKLVQRLSALQANPFEPIGEVSKESIDKAVRWLSKPPYLDVVHGACATVESGDDAALIRTTSRAIVAFALGEDSDPMGAGPSALYLPEIRTALVHQIEDLLSDGEKADIGDILKDKVINWAKTKGTRFARKNRKRVMDFASPAMGDIVYTQRRGENVLDLLKTEIEAIDDDIILLGHSLGGVLSMDLLSGRLRPANVTKLVTAGSQPSYFGGADSLETLRLDLTKKAIALPGEFPPWLNFYDPSDFLSFRVEDLFDAPNGIEDFEIRSRAPFPDAHGAYFRQDRMYYKLIEFMQS